MALIVAMVPMPIRCLMTCWAGTPMASEKLRTVQGRSSVTLLLRGAAVLAPVVRRLARLNRGGERAAPRRPLFFGGATTGGFGRSAFAAELTLFAVAQQRIDHGRVADFAAFRFFAAGRSGGASAAAPRRTRSRPGRPRGSSDLPAARATSSVVSFRFCSCLRRCSESGLLPWRLPRSASAGSFRSGFCGVGSCNRRLQRRLLDAGHGGELGCRAGDGRSWRSALGVSLPFDFLPPLPRTGILSDAAAGPEVVFTANDRRLEPGLRPRWPWPWHVATAGRFGAATRRPWPPSR